MFMREKWRLLLALVGVVPVAVLSCIVLFTSSTNQAFAGSQAAAGLTAPVLLVPVNEQRAVYPIEPAADHFPVG
jgi:hypothetical protein